MNKVLTSHKSDYWKTPKKIYEGFKRNKYFDPCPENPEFNGLEIEWKERNFVNPPYSQISKWVTKAIIEAGWYGRIVTFLIPARTDTKWFKALWEYGAYFEFITGRIHFNDEKKGAPFPSMYVTLNRYGIGKSKATIIKNPENQFS